MSTGKKKSIDQLESAEVFFRETPLYASFSLTDENNRITYGSISRFNDYLNCYCPWCKDNSVFRPEPRPIVIGGVGKSGLSQLMTSHTIQPEIKTILLFCSRDSQHQLQFVIKCDGQRFSKIGQDPSIVELQKPNLAKYRKVLGDELHNELVRAVGLSAHGVGIGAFVYLRRIFESLIEAAHQREMLNPNWNEEEFQRRRVVEKIGMLHHQLPKFLVENAKLYGILSKGIHELSEDQCLGYFTIVRSGIELILDETLREKERQSKEAEIAKSISDLNSRLG